MTFAYSDDQVAQIQALLSAMRYADAYRLAAHFADLKTDGTRV